MITAILALIVPGACRPVAEVVPLVTCCDQGSMDQDDICIWVHPSDPAQSAVIASDKKADRIIVYDLEGRTLQIVPALRSGNIDVRYGFPLGGTKIDIAACNLRGDHSRIAVYRINPASRQLDRVDNNGIMTGESYGGALYHSPKTGKFYFITTSKEANIEQHELLDDGRGSVQGLKVRQWKTGPGEAVVADDEKARLFIAEEQKGVWEVGAEPDDPAPGSLVIRAGEHGLKPDVEGLAIYALPHGQGYLLVSSQGNSTFKIYKRDDAHDFIGTFTVRSARETDGIEVTGRNLGGQLSKGLFACHSGVPAEKCPVYLCSWEAIAGAVKLNPAASREAQK
jgi:3-phytase